MFLMAGALRPEQLPEPEEVAYAKTLQEVEAEKKEKQAQIEAKQQELAALGREKEDTEEYQTALQEKIDLINGKMALIDAQIQSLNTEIADKQSGVAGLESKIAQQQEAVDEGLEVFKARIRSLYIHGNDSILSALVGSSDFYDVLTRIDMMNRIAKHDDNLVSNLKRQLSELNANQDDLSARLQALNVKQAELDSVKQEFASSRAELDEAMAQTEESKKQLALDEAAANGQLSAAQQELLDLEAEGERLEAEAARQAYEEQLRQQEEERRRQEEEERRKQEAAAQATATTPTKPTQTSQQGTQPQQTSRTTVTTTKQPSSSSTTTTEQAPPASGTPQYQGGSLAWPAPGFYHISSPFGQRWGRAHNGIDISGGGIYKSNACAAAAGTVVKTYSKCTHYNGCSCNSGFGNYVVIDHGNGLRTLYAHLYSLNVSVGQQVSAGTVIGHIGSTGNSTGPHLHFSVLVGGTYVDPMKYLY